MITVIGLNPAYDYTMILEDVQLGQVNRVNDAYYQVAGKGADVAYCMSVFNHPVAIMGFLGAKNKALFEHFYQQHAIDDKSIVVDGYIRTNVITISNQTVTNFNTGGNLETHKYIECLMKSIQQQCKVSDTFILSGSIPIDAPNDVYKTIITFLKQQGKGVYFDSSDVPLALGIESMPDFIKPNRQEFCTLLNLRNPDMDTILSNAIVLHQKGIKIVCVSLGKDGCVCVSNDGIFTTTVTPVDTVKSTVGAGDGFVAGFAYCQSQGKSVADSLHFASAVSRSIVQTLGPRLHDLHSVYDNMEYCTVKKI